MSQLNSTSLSLKSLFGVLRTNWLLLVVPLVAVTCLSAGYAAVRSKVWKASQALLIRDEAVGTLNRQGRFDNIEAMKTAQETIAEIAKNQAVVKAALSSLPRPAELAASAPWPGADDVAQVQSRITVTAPKGAEFGRTEVIYLATTAASRERAVELATAVCDQLEARLQQVRNTKAESVIAEMLKTVSLAQAELDQATAQLAAMETEVGSDLGELRILNDSGSGDSNLRTALNQIKNDLRQVRTASEADQQQLRLLETAQKDADSLIATPNRLLEAQPALRRLKDGLVDAQLRTAQLMGKMSSNHPEVRAAEANEVVVRKQLYSELEISVRGLRADLAVSQSQIDSLEKQARDVENRLNHLAGLRAGYANLVAEVRQCSETLQRAQKELSDARASQGAARSASLITRLDHPVTGNSPVGPATSMIVLSGAAGGLATGLGLVFLLTPTGPLRGRRWSDYFRGGRRLSDQKPGRRTDDTPKAPNPQAVAASNERRAGSDRRSSEATGFPPGEAGQPMEPRPRRQRAEDQGRG